MEDIKISGDNNPRKGDNVENKENYKSKPLKLFFYQLNFNLFSSSSLRLEIFLMSMETTNFTWKFLVFTSLFDACYTSEIKTYA